MWRSTERANLEKKPSIRLSQELMAYDAPATMAWNAGKIPVFVSVRGADAEEINRYWEKLSEGATVVQPLAAAGWSPLYGMLKDRFGVTWVLDVQAE